MTAFAKEAGWFIGVAILVLAIAAAGRLNSKSDECARRCAPHGVASFEFHDNGCGADTYDCECIPSTPTTDGGAGR